ncbi:MAG TPA: SDR family oxidoreductase [Novosphingobium sp.]|nr:SDR family oxidoreductase [Novosphingobium sp.]
MSEKPVALVSGCSSGVGLHTAVRLAQAGYAVVATMRDMSRRVALDEAGAAAGVVPEVAPLDVADAASIAACVSGAIARHGRIDVLVNNAGAGFLGSLEQTSEADLRRTMEVNFFGVWNLTKAVVPQMRAQGSGRIVSVTSVGGLLGQPFNEAYCAAKFAVEGMMEGFAPLARQMGITVALVEPGPINTEFVASARSSSAASIGAMAAPYDALAANYMRAMGGVFAEHGQTGDEVAEIVVAVATADQPDFRNVTSAFARAMVTPKVVDFTGNNVVDAFAARLSGRA